MMGVILYVEPLEEKTAQKTASSSKQKRSWGSPAVSYRGAKGALPE